MGQTAWPAWDNRSPLDLVRYVSTHALISASLQPQERLFRSDPAEAAAVAAAAYDLLHARQIPYAHAPFSDGPLQYIRSPQEMVQSAATCLEFAVTYAAIAWQAQLRPFLVLADAGGARHALVVVDLQDYRGDGYLESADPLDPVPPDDPIHGGPGRPTAGLYRLDRTADRGRLLPIDAAGCAVGEDGQSSFDEAVAAGQAWLAGSEDLLLIDVLHARTEHGIEELAAPDPRTWPPIHSRLVAPAGEFDPYPSRAAIEERLEHVQGRLVLFGASGMGKSMLAYRAAMAAKHGYGWFLAADDPVTLRQSLAMAELAEQPARRDVFNREVFAQLALSRLQSTSAPWVVVLDNADCDPQALERLIPRPGSGQTLIVTTANEAWVGGDAAAAMGGPAVVERLQPLQPNDASYPFPPAVARLVGGSPLLGQALRDAQAVLGDLPSPLPAEGPADFVWRAGVSALSAQARAAADMLAWSPATGIAPQQITAMGLAAADFDEVIAVGLAGRDGAGAVHMHRLLRRAGRSASDPGMSPVPALLTHEACERGLALAADDELLTDMQQHLAAAHPDLRVGRAWLGLARIWSQRGRPDTAAALFDTALRASSPHLGPCEWADCLHGKARAVFLDADADADAQEQALAWLEGVWTRLDPLDDEQQLRRQRAIALHALIRRDRIAATIDRDPDAAREALYEVRAALAESLDERRLLLQRLHLPGLDDIERGVFNLAGVDAMLARCLTGSAAQQSLDQARQGYQQVRQMRLERYGDFPAESVAACFAGEGEAAYAEALLRIANQPAGRPLDAAATQDITELLRDATQTLYRALVDRQTVDGAVDRDATSGSLDALLKVLLLRRAMAESPANPSSAAAVLSVGSVMLEFSADLARQQEVRR